MLNKMVCNYCKGQNSELCSICKSPEQEIKTLGGWHESKINSITEYLNQGDEVNEDLFNYFLDIMPPISLNSGNGIVFAGFQVSEPYSLRKNDKGEYSATYMTFGSKGDKYYYLGLNFNGEAKSEFYNKEE